MFARLRHKVKGHCAIYLDQAGLAICYAVGDSANEQKIQHVAFHPGVAYDTLVDFLRGFVSLHHLKGAPCYWVLDDTCHQLLQIDALAVPANELRQAVGWRIKDILDYPLEQAVFDVLCAPTVDAHARHLFVAVAKQQVLAQVVGLIQASGLRLQVIDISELALRNISALLPEEKQGQAVAVLMPTRSQMVITKQRQLCFSKQLNVDITPLLHRERIVDKTLQNLALEIQRCYDYFISQMRQVAPKQLVLAPTFAVDDQLLRDRLASLLDTHVIMLDLNQLLGLDNAFADTVLQQNLFAIGGALRTEVRESSYAS